MKIKHRWGGHLGVQNWVGYDDVGRLRHHRHNYELAHTDLVTETIRLAGENAALKAEVERLHAWKADTMAVESTWNDQAVAKLIGVPLGGKIRPAIQPAIERLIAEVERLKKALTFVIDDYRQVDLHHSASCWPDDVLETCKALVPSQLWPEDYDPELADVLEKENKTD